MTAPAQLQRLLTWLSPAFPVGGFAWSQGLETAIADRRVRDAATLREWISGTLLHAGLRTDAIVLARAHADYTDALSLQNLADLSFALIPARERCLETALTGDAFAIAARAWPSDVFARLPDPCPYHLAVGAIAGAHGINSLDAAIAYLTTAVHTQVSVAVRLVPLGQTAGLQVVAALEATVRHVAQFAIAADLNDIAGIGYATDIAQMRHEGLEPRVFRS